jgi:hypothetical protein
MDVMHRVHRDFEAFNNPDRDNARFIELRIFPKYDKVLVPWPRGVEPWLA